MLIRENVIRHSCTRYSLIVGIELSLQGTEPWLALWIINILTLGQPCHFDPALAGEESPQKQQRTKGILHSVPILGTPFRMTAHHMSIVTIPRACERRSEAISFKATTDINDSSFHRNPSETGRDQRQPVIETRLTYQFPIPNSQLIHITNMRQRIVRLEYLFSHTSDKIETMVLDS